jgi:hypothetical protein
MRSLHSHELWNGFPQSLSLDKVIEFLIDKGSIRTEDLLELVTSEEHYISRDDLASYLMYKTFQCESKVRLRCNRRPESSDAVVP